MHTKLVPIKLENYKPLREIVYETLRDAVISGTLQPGERLMEIQLADEMGVSRTPVREAIRKLELENFVVMIPRKGAYVANITLKDIADVYEVRGALEDLTAGLVTERITQEEQEELERILVEITDYVNKDDVEGFIEADTRFHDMLYQLTRNERLMGIVNNLREQIQRFRKSSLRQPGRMKLALEEHIRIVDAIAQNDIDLARKYAREHIENAEHSMIEAVKFSADPEETKEQS